MMTTLKRQNKMGLSYEFRGELTGTETTIECVSLKKTLMVKHNIVQMNRAWFNWIRLGQFIQEAFSFLDAGEREFLMTGILPAEFIVLMGEIDE